MDNETTQFVGGQEIEFKVGDNWRKGALGQCTINGVWIIGGIDGMIYQRYPSDIRPIQSDPIPQPAAIQYPPLRNMENGKPLSTWKQLLRMDAWAVSAQPHLYFLGHYRSDVYDLEQFAKDTPNFILMATIACSNAALGGSETQPYHTVFIITEGA